MTKIAGKTKRLKCYHCGKIVRHTATGKIRSHVTWNNTRDGTQATVDQAQVTCSKCGETYYTARILE